jgi:hypothetical protein
MPVRKVEDGLLSAPGSPVQLTAAGAGSAAVMALPWTLIPTAPAPFHLVVDRVTFRQLREAAGAVPDGQLSLEMRNCCGRRAALVSGAAPRLGRPVA